MESEPERASLARRLHNACNFYGSSAPRIYDVERRPRWTFTYGAEQFSPCSLPIRELVSRIPAPCRDHCKNEEPTFAEQLLISARIEPADLLGHMGEVELDRPVTTGLEIYE